MKLGKCLISELQLPATLTTPVLHDQTFADTKRLFGSTTRVTRVSLTDMRNINNPALQAERLVLLPDKSNLF